MCSCAVIRMDAYRCFSKGGATVENGADAQNRQQFGLQSVNKKPDEGCALGESTQTPPLLDFTVLMFL
jgi:hypothetical protein